MAFIVTGRCLNCKHTDCVDVCPVDCFSEDDQMLYIDPDSCIDCAACVPECPVEAIFEKSEVPEIHQKWIAINSDRAPAAENITEKKDPLPTARTLDEILSQEEKDSSI